MNKYNQKKLRKLIPLPVIFGIFSSAITYFRLKPEEHFLKEWLPFYISGLLIIAPIAILLFIGINNILNKYIKIENKILNGLIFGLLFSGSVGFLLSTLLTFLSNDYSNSSDFLIIWKSNVYSFLPRILIIGPLVGVIIKPFILKMKNQRLIK